MLRLFRVPLGRGPLPGKKQSWLRRSERGIESVSFEQVTQRPPLAASTPLEMARIRSFLQAARASGGCVGALRSALPVTLPLLPRANGLGAAPHWIDHPRGKIRQLGWNFSV